MQWNLLEKEKCPRCEYRLAEAEKGYKCTNPDCDFFITNAKMTELTSKFNRDDWRRSDEFEGYGF